MDTRLKKFYLGACRTPAARREFLRLLRTAERDDGPTLFAEPGGRRRDPVPRVCRFCGFVGAGRDWVHAYRGDGAGDVEPAEKCPKCRAWDD